MDIQERTDKWLDAPERLSCLTERQLVAFLLSWIGFSQEEIGLIVGVSQQAVSCRIRAATRKLREAK